MGMALDARTVPLSQGQRVGRSSPATVLVIILCRGVMRLEQFGSV